MENVSFIDRLKLLNLFSLQGRLLRSSLALLWKIFRSLSPINPNMLFQAAPLTSTIGHPVKYFFRIPDWRLARDFLVYKPFIVGKLSPVTQCAQTLNRFKALLVRDLWK